MANAFARAGQLVASASLAQQQHSMNVKWESSSNIDDNSSVKSNASKVSNTSKVETTKKVVLVGNAPSHADSNSIVDTGSIASQGSKRSAATSISANTSNAQTEIKRRRFYNQTCGASSCSESVSSAGTGGGSTISIPSSSASMGPLCLSLPFRTLRGALRLAVALVLEYSYKHRGGYKLSPAEKRRFEVLQLQLTSASATSVNASSSSSANRDIREKNATYHPSQTDVAFMERRMRLLKMLGGGKSGRSSASRMGSGSDGGFTTDTSIDSMRRKSGEDFILSNQYGPPFTIQRVAEVLLTPERVSV